MYRIALTIACISALRLRPPGFTAGISPDNNSHCTAVRLLGYDGFMALVMLSIISVFSTDSIPLPELSYFSDILLVSEDLREESLHATPMRDFQGQPIWLPSRSQYHPRLEALRWHREHIFNVE